VIRLADSVRSGFVAGLTDTGIAAYCMIFPVVQVGVVIADANGGFGHGVWALAATAAYVPLYMRHILYFIRGRRPPAAGWTVAAVTIVIAGAVPLVGQGWLPSFFAVAVCLLAVLPWRWSLPAVAALALAQAPLAVAFPLTAPAAFRGAPYYYAITMLWRTSAVFIPVWLVAVVRQLETARNDLARDAVLRERLTVDSRLRATLGVALASISARGQKSASLAGIDPDSATTELAELAAISRGALADTRQLLNGLRQPALRAELEAAARLLTAAGIATRLIVPAGDPPGSVGPELRDGLRSATARLLLDGSARACVITLAYAGERVQLGIQVDGQQVDLADGPES
jgi:signal transduction histidine kinase